MFRRRCPTCKIKKSGEWVGARVMCLARHYYHWAK